MDAESVLCFDASLNKRIRLDQLCDGVNDCIADNDNNSNNNNNDKTDDEQHCSSDGAYTGVFIPHGNSSLILAGSSCLCLSPTSVLCPGGLPCQICEVDEKKVSAGKECLIRDGRRWDDLNLEPRDYPVLDMILIKDRGRWKGKKGDKR